MGGLSQVMNSYSGNQIRIFVSNWDHSAVSMYGSSAQCLDISSISGIPSIDLRELDALSALIFTRELVANAYVLELIRRARSLGISVYWLLDDHPQLLLPGYSISMLREVGHCFDGILTPCENLVTWCDYFDLSPCTTWWRTVINSDLLEAVSSLDQTFREPGTATIASPSGAFRWHGQTGRELMASLCQTQGFYTLLTRKGSVPAMGSLGPDSFRSLEMQATGHFQQFLFNWKLMRPSIVLHPKVDQPYAPFKSLEMLLVAFYWGTPFAFPSEPPWESVEETTYLRRCSNAADYIRCAEEWTMTEWTPKDVRSVNVSATSRHFPREPFEETLRHLQEKRALRRST